MAVDGRLTRRALLALGLAGAGSLLAACQQPTSPSRSGAPTPVELLKTPAPKPTQTPAVARPPEGQGTPVPWPPKPGGSMVWAAEADPLDLDPYTAGSVSAWGDLTYQSLVMFDENLKLVPCLAEAWRVSDDRLTWTFTLRQGVRFHDGSEFEAEDVRFWFERITARQPASPYAPLFSPVKQVTLRGRYEVELTLHAPHAPLLATFAALRGSAMAPRAWLQGAAAAAQTTAVGSGPFRIADYVPRSHIRYVRHRDYWETGLPYLDEVRLEIIPDEAQRVEAVRSGRVRYALVGPAAAGQVKGDLRVLSSAGPVQRLTTFNTLRKPFDDVRVRQALGLAVDRRAAIQRLLGGEGRLTGPVPSGLGAWAPSPDSLPYRTDLAMARRLLNDAGYSDGFEATIRTSAEDPSTLGTAQLLAEQAKPLGITLTVEPLDRAALTRSVGAGDFDVASTVVGFLPDPDGYLSPYSSRGRAPGAASGSSWTNPRYDELVEQARTTLDPGARKSLYDEATAIVMREVPSIWWFSEPLVEVLHPSVVGYRQSFTGRRLGLKKTWLDG